MRPVDVPIAGASLPGRFVKSSNPSIAFPEVATSFTGENARQVFKCIITQTSR
jgi:hypothetical protein